MRERTIPNFLEATSKKELRLMMGALQSRHKLNIHFYDFQKDGKKYVCWFDVPLSRELAIELAQGEKTNAET